MPIVKQYERQAQETPLPAVRRQEYRIAQVEAPERRVTPTPESLGAGFGQALAQVGQQIYAQEQQKNDDVRMLQSRRKVSDWLVQNVYDPENGMIAKNKGEASYGLPDQFQKGFQDFTGDVRKGLANDRQRLRFDEMVQGMGLQTLDHINSHVAQQRSQIDVDEAKATVSNSQQIAVANKYDAKSIGGAMDTIQTIDAQFAKRNGWGPEATQALIDGDLSNLHVGILNAMLDEGNPNNAAKGYFDRVQGQIMEPQRSKFRGMTTQANTLTLSQQITDTIKQKLGKDASLTDMYDAIPSYTQNPEVRKLVEEQVRTWNTATREESRLKEESASKNAKSFMDQLETQIKNSMDAAPRSLSYEQVVPQSVRNQLSEPVERAQREYWKMITEAKEPKTDPGTFYQLYSVGTAEATKDQFAKTNLMQYVNRLSRGDFSKLVELQGAIRKGDDKKTDELSLGYRNTNEMVQDSMRVLGLDPTPKDGTDEAKRLGRLHQAVDQDMQDWESLPQNKGKKPSKAEIQQMIDNHLIQGTVSTPGTFYGVNKEQKYAIDTTPDENFSLAIQQVPAEERRKIETALVRAGVPQISEKMILDMYLKKIRKTK